MDRAEVDVKLSDKTEVVISKLDSLESMKADEYIGASKSAALANKVYAIASIRKINGEAVIPLKNLAEFQAVAKRLDVTEVMRLGLAVDEINPVPDDLKKILEARQEDSSPNS